MNEAELDRLRRELPALVAGLAATMRKLLAAPNEKRRLNAEADALLALQRFDRWLAYAGGEELLAEAMREDVKA
jgi:hypothetical protein